jgi:hypothetical protein
VDEQDKRLERIESKVDRMSEAIVSLARMEERMITLFKRMDTYDEQQNKIITKMQDIEVKQASSVWVERVMWVCVAAIISWLFK